MQAQRDVTQQKKRNLRNQSMLFHLSGLCFADRL